jgi:hypothetical protein
MKNIILCSSFYNDIESLSKIVSELQFIENVYGKEIEDFNYIPDQLEEMISSVLEGDIEIQPDTGTFRKPNSTVHFDNFYEHALWTCIVALEDTVLNVHQHKDGYQSYFDIPKDDPDFFLHNCMTQEKWDTIASINIKKNDYVFIRPWLWKSLQEDKIVQMFLINAKIKENNNVRI